jgi:hypothetical protein
MNIYEDEMLEQKLDEISNQMGHLVMDILLLSLQKLGNQSQVFNDFTETRLATDTRKDPF